MSSSPPSLRVPASRTPLSPEAELRLRDRLLEDERGAWTDFDAAYGRLVLATISRIVGRFGASGCSEDTREIQASFCLELLANDKAKLRAFSPERGARLSTWIAMLASHAAYDFLRRRRREPWSSVEWDADMYPSDSPDPHRLCELEERARLVATLARDFTAKDREFLELYFAEGLTPDEVAAKMGISVKTVYSKKHKIQGRLEALLERRHLAA